MKKNILIFMSGSGSNAEAILEFAMQNSDVPYNVLALVTDRPEMSRAVEIGANYNLPVIELDIFKFYAQHGEKNIGLINEKRWEIRELWTQELSKKIKDLNQHIDFILLAGFEPLTNITNAYVTLNIHPGDLTFEIDGERVLNGLSIKPIERAIVLGQKYLRSSVIIAQSFSGKDSDIDAGPILGVSAPVTIEYMGEKLEELQEIYNNRPEKLNKGYSDKLRVIANENLKNLKYNGDHVVFVPVVVDFALGKFKVDANHNLFYREDNSEKFQAIKTVEYSTDSKKLWLID